MAEAAVDGQSAAVAPSSAVDLEQGSSSPSPNAPIVPGGVPENGKSDEFDAASEKVDNGRGWARGLAVFNLVVLAAITGLLWNMVALKGADGTDIQNRVSSSLTVMASIQSLALFWGVWDLFRVNVDYPASNQLVKFETQHSIFKRASIPVFLSLLIFLPSIATFTLHSLGSEFWEIMEDSKGHMDSGIRAVIQYLISCFCILLLAVVLHLVYAEWMMRTVFWVVDSSSQVSAKKQQRVLTVRQVTGVFSMLAASMFLGAVIWSLALISHNSGIVIGFVLYCLVFLPFALVCGLSFIVRPFDWVDQPRVQRARNVAVMIAAACYLIFWISLVVLILEGVWEQGFWETISGRVPQDEGLCAKTANAICNFNKTRSAVVFSQMVLMILLVFTFFGRVLLHKVRRRWTLPREEFPDSVLETRRRLQEERRGHKAKIVASFDQDQPPAGSSSDESKDQKNLAPERRLSVSRPVFVDETQQAQGSAAAVSADQLEQGQAEEQKQD